ncbi:MAG TPA: FHA domain-containing protein, partial [Ilumatobacteraceae bacterium]|nr:FHA domain-containing protein [Ilumatobacteraceae bacterium]
MTDIWTFAWVAGPDAGGTALLGRGSHMVGRAAGADVRCDDGALEPHHLLIEVSPSGLSLRQLTGRIPVRLNGEPVADMSVIDAPARLEIGHSILTVCRGDLTAPAQRTDRASIKVTPAGRVLMRSPRAANPWSPEPVAAPADRVSPSDAGGGLLPAMLALGGSGLLAMLLHQPMFLLFGAIG